MSASDFEDAAAPNRRNGEADGQAVSQIRLAQELPLALGPLQIDPALRRVAHEDGREEFLQPRVMQVLVALVRAEGQILSRDDLLRSCWSGLIVGEDAIDRVIGRLRRLADWAGGGAFDVQTITKVGYRLTYRDARPSPRPSQAARSSICVLPFANMSDDLQQDYFSDGISEDIITDLSKVSSLFVVARTSSFAFKGKNPDIPQIARQLHVGHVLEGSVRKSGGRVRITAQLIDAASGGHVWAERFDRDLKDIFALQDEISQAIVAALKLKLLPEEKRAIEHRGTTNLEAYNLYLLARRYYVPGCGGDTRALEAIERICQGAIEIDASYARAWTLLGVAQTLLHFNYGRAGESGLTAIQRALELDGNLAEAHAVMARHLSEQGQDEEAFARADLALALDPESWAANSEAARLYYKAHRFRDAIRHWEKAVLLPETSRSDPGLLMSCYSAVGDLEGAQRAARMALARAEEALAQDHVDGAAIGCGASALAVLGKPDQARDLIRRALLIDPDNLRMRYNFACGAVLYLKDIDMALDLLGSVFARMSVSWLRHAELDPDLDSIRGLPSYRAMVAAAEERFARAA
ncbi:winged helix-turn-helix domain-containing protein [Phenylobacterium sp. LjRoot164]|uniref:winged helix-turn-helix domain-containing tetratricopeptide repeat protein n=1 Tax=unclassified Phenylobacterium TaxID=2640670 RepID=UPI003ECE9CD5